MVRPSTRSGRIRRVVFSWFMPSRCNRYTFCDSRTRGAFTSWGATTSYTGCCVLYPRRCTVGRLCTRLSCANDVRAVLRRCDARKRAPGASATGLALPKSFCLRETTQSCRRHAAAVARGPSIPSAAADACQPECPRVRQVASETRWQRAGHPRQSTASRPRKWRTRAAKRTPLRATRAVGHVQHAAVVGSA